MTPQADCRPKEDKVVVFRSIVLLFLKKEGTKHLDIILGYFDTASITKTNWVKKLEVQFELERSVDMQKYTLEHTTT